MTDKLKKAAPVIWEEIKKAKNILMHCHPGPDPDSLGSTLGLMHILEPLGKKVTVIKGDSSLQASFKCIPGFEKIIEKNYFEINVGDFDLFLILDTGGINQISKMGEIVFPESLRTVLIDHHDSNMGFADIDLVDNQYGATCWMIYDLVKEWGLTIEKEAALCLFLGIYADTGGFKYPKTTKETLVIAAELAGMNPNFPQVIFELENNNYPKSLEFSGLALSSIELYFSGAVAISAVKYKELQIRGIEKMFTENNDIPNRLKSVVGWNIGISFFETEPGAVNCSFRTRDANKWDVSKIAKATGYGGGLKAAAGAKIPMPFDEAKKLLLETIKKVYPDLGEP